jgi:hypothetical protein
MRKNTIPDALPNIKWPTVWTTKYVGIKVRSAPDEKLALGLRAND